MALSILLHHGRFSKRALTLWLSFCWLAGVYLVLAVPVALPGGLTEDVQVILVHRNFHDLIPRGLLSLSAVLLAGGGLGVLLFAVTWLIARWDPPCARPPAHRWSWLRYSLLMAVAWTVYLLAFWPGILSSDSLDQWQQAQSGHFVNFHPAFHTLSIWLVTRLWNSPTCVALIQIFALSGLIGWELGVFRRRGMLESAAWLVTLLFALSPVVGITVITLWKDIPYSTALLWISFLVLNIALNPNEWLSSRTIWLALGISAALIVLFRHNGVAVGPVVLAVLALIYRRSWRVFAAAFALFLGIWLAVQGPLYTLLRVERNVTLTASLPIHHIAAHLASGEEFSAADLSFLEQILPLDDWSYDCYTVNPILFHPNLNSQFIVQNSGAINQLALRLMLKHPSVDFQKTLCAGSMVYRVQQPQETYFFTEQPWRDDMGSVRYISSNKLGLVEQPILTNLTNRLMIILGWSTQPDHNGFFWRPATYLYLFLLLGCALALRARSWKLGLFLLPGLVQSVVLFLAIIAQDFRYQFAIYMLGLFSAALIFLPILPGEE